MRKCFSVSSISDKGRAQRCRDCVPAIRINQCGERLWVVGDVAVGGLNGQISAHEGDERLSPPRVNRTSEEDSGTVEEAVGT
jgi:hypothetical protein